MKSRKLSAVLVATAMLTGNAYAEIIAGGNSCTAYGSTNCSWSIDDTGKLTIYPTNSENEAIARRGFNNTKVSWEDYKDSITSLDIKEGVSSISNVDFSNYKALKTVSIANTLETLSYQAFAGSGITSINIPNSVTSIPNTAFMRTTDLEEVTLGNSITSIGQFAFRLSGVKHINIPDSVEYISSYAFDSSGLEEIVLGNGVKKIDYNAFDGAENLSKIVLSESLTEIGQYAFRSVAADSFVLPDSLFSEGAKLATDFLPYDTKNIYCSAAVEEKCRAYMSTAYGGYCPGTGGGCPIHRLNGLVDIQIYTKEDGMFVLTDSEGNKKYYASAGDLQDGTICDSSCQRSIRLAASGMTYERKRIYTVEEAERVSKPTGNRIMLRYK